MKEKILKSFPKAEIQNISGNTYLVKNKNEKLFLKFFLSFEEKSAEKKNYQLFTDKCPFRKPKIIDEKEGFLIFEFIERGQATKKTWQIFKENLDAMHAQSQDHFGNDFDNYIGGLKQKNGLQKRWSDFFWEKRILPYAKHLDSKDISLIKASLESFEKNCNPKPSLIHGDLWSGNLIVGEAGEPVLIDFCPSYSIPEMDYAMMQLFSGFDYPYPKDPYLGLWQSYYLLIHVELFGSSYLAQTKSAIRSIK